MLLFPGDKNRSVHQSDLVPRFRQGPCRQVFSAYQERRLSAHLPGETRTAQRAHNCSGRWTREENQTVGHRSGGRFRSGFGKG